MDGIRRSGFNSLRVFSCLAEGIESSQGRDGPGFYLLNVRSIGPAVKIRAMSTHFPNHVLRPLHVLCLALLFTACTADGEGIDPEALALRDQGFAELENEHPEQAEETYRKLVETMPGDPLGWANLAIAELRQQSYADAQQAIDKALELAPGRGDLLAIKAEILQWEGDVEAGLELMRQAVAASPEDLEILYSTYQMATTARGETADALAGEVMAKLAELRPENLVVLLQRGQRAIAAGDRTVATGSFLRVAQLLWQADPVAGRALEAVNNALRQDDLAGARVPALRLENVLKITPMFRESLRELKTGIQGIPVLFFANEPEPTAFGESLDITFAGTSLDSRPGHGVAVGDFDGDGRPDIARLRGGEGAALEVRRASAGWKVGLELPAPGLVTLLAADLDNDTHLDLVASGPEGGRFYKGAGDGTFTDTTEAFGLGAASGVASTVVDHDIEGDLDLVMAGDSGIELWRNALDGALHPVADRSLPGIELAQARSVVPSDLDRDGDLDLAVAHVEGVRWLDNLRQGRFRDRTAEAGLGGSGDVAALVSADLDSDGFPELVTAGSGVAVWGNRSGRFESSTLAGLPGDGTFHDLLAFDGDNDGRFDLVLAGPEGVQVLGQETGGGFRGWTVEGAGASSALASADLDGDGDLDLVTSGDGGLSWLENRGGNKNRWLALRLRGLDKGNSKNNVYGVGSVVEVRAGQAFQFHEAAGDVVHIGLGSFEAAPVLRVVWTNGVPQNRLQLAGNQRVVEEQLLKGSCPFLYTWNGEEMAFVTDLLWGAPLGLPVADGVYASSDPSELVQVDGAVPRDGVYDLRITEELWEAAFFDHVRLWVVDHPEAVEVASNLRVQPGESLPEVVHGSRDLRPVAAAWDGEGRNVTDLVARRDEVYADGYRASRYQGVAAEPWNFTFDLGEAPTSPVRLHLDGWIFPADASLNLAVAQRQDLPYLPPRLEVETSQGWQTLIESTGFPAGKTKTLVLDLPPLPEGAQRLRLVTSLWLHWDRIAWTASPADAEAVVIARKLPSSAELHYRGFSALERVAPNAPHSFDYSRVRLESPWLPFPGAYTRYGDVLPLLETPDDFSVILAPGDEMVIRLDVSDLPPPEPGRVRTLFLESHGWDKDADRNTFAAPRLEPLPFRAMSGYPWGPDESYPDTEEHRRYQEQWLTRELR